MIKIKYDQLHNTAEFLLNEVSAKGKKNIHRMRVVNAINDQNQKIAEEEASLVKEFAKLNDDGEPIVKDNGSLDIDDKEGFIKAQEELYDEYFTIDDVNLESALKTVEKLITNFDKELQGNSAVAHAILFEAFEENKEDK